MKLSNHSQWGIPALGLRRYLLNSCVLQVVLVCLVLIAMTVPLQAQWNTILPQFVTGGGWSSDLFIDNQGIGMVNGIQVSFFASNGSPMVVDTNLGTNSAFTLNLTPGATQALQVSAAGILRVGYVVIRTPTLASIRTSEVFRYAPGGTALTELGVPQQFPFIHFSFPAEVDSTRGVNTGIAVANATFSSASATDQKIVVDIIRNNGTLQNTAILPLAMGEQKPLFLTELFPGLDHFSGTVSVSGAVRFGILGLRQDQGVFASVSIDPGANLAPFTLGISPTTEVEPNNSTALAQTLSGSTLVTGTINPAGDLDYFKFIATQGDIVTAMIEAQSTGSSLDSVLRLEKSDGSIVSQNDQNGLLFQNDSFLRLVLPASGTYYLRVSDFFGDGGSNYNYRLHFRLQSGSAPPNQPQIMLLTPNTAVRGTTVGLTIQGTNLLAPAKSDVNNANPVTINFNPSDGITLSNVNATSNQVTAQLTVSPTATLGTRQVSVMTAAGTSNSLPFSITDPGGGSNFNGNWSGTTGQGKSFTFTISNNALRLLSFSGTVPACSFDTTVNTNLPLAGSLISFSISGGPGGVSFTVNGSFTSNTTASGTVNFTVNPIPGVPSCSGSASTTWSATKN